MFVSHYPGEDTGQEYYLGEKDHHKRVTTENTDGHGRKKVDPNSLFRVFPCIPWLIFYPLRAVVGGGYTEAA
jgi:hypothetical protein